MLIPPLIKYTGNKPKVYRIPIKLLTKSVNWTSFPLNLFWLARRTSLQLNREELLPELSKLEFLPLTIWNVQSFFCSQVCFLLCCFGLSAWVSVWGNSNHNDSSNLKIECIINHTGSSFGSRWKLVHKSKTHHVLSWNKNNWFLIRRAFTD